MNSVLLLKDTIIRYELELLAGLSKKYSPAMVREFYASYAAIVLGSLPKGKNPLTQLKLTYTRVRGQQVHISEITIHQKLFGLEFLALRSTPDFDRRLG